MSISEMQACLARLYVDGSLRRLFELEPKFVLDQYRLDDPEKEALLGIDRGRLVQFAASLITKRRARFQASFPLFFKVLPGIANRLFERFSQLRRISPHDRHAMLISDFGHFAEETFACDPGLPFFAQDLLRYERFLAERRMCSRRAASSGAEDPVDWSANGLFPTLSEQVRVARFNCEIEEVARRIEEETDPASAGRGSCYIAFSPRAKWGQARTFRLTPATKALIDLCDGTRTIDQISAALRERFGESGPRSLPGILSKLAGFDLIVGRRREEARP